MAPSSSALKLIKLTAARTDSAQSLERAMARRRSSRKLARGPLTWDEIGQLLWSAQGISEPKDGLRTTPSAGALYPLEVYVATADGLFHYRPKTHELAQTLARDVRDELRRASFDQECMDAPCVIAIAAIYERVTHKYPDIGKICVDFEVGHCAQNVLLQVVALDLAAVPVAAFDPRRVAALLDLHAPEVPLYLIPVGRPG
jgi:SagB-type dehydrogenase family enzyme